MLEFLGTKIKVVRVCLAAISKRCENISPLILFNTRNDPATTKANYFAAFSGIIKHLHRVMAKSQSKKRINSAFRLKIWPYLWPVL